MAVSRRVRSAASDQQNSVAYLEAKRCLVDMARNMMRKEQELVFELSETAFNTRPNRCGKVDAEGDAFSRSWLSA